MRHELIYTLAILTLFVPLATHAADVDWNDELTREILKENDIGAEPGGMKDSAWIQRMLEAEILIESERLSMSGVQILERNKALEREQGLDSVALNARFPEYWGVWEVKNPDGTETTLYRALSPQEVQEMRFEANGSSAQAMADMMNGMSDGMLTLGFALRKGIDDAGFGGFLGDESTSGKFITDGDGYILCQGFLSQVPKYLKESGDIDRPGQWEEDESILLAGIGKDMRVYPLMYMLGPACMLAATAKQLENIESPSPEDYAAAKQKAADEAGKYATLGGTEIIDGQEATRIDITGLDHMSQTLEDGRKIDISSMSVWIDTEYFKRRKFRMEGTMSEGRKSDPFYMEREYQDYRRVGDSYLYEPYLEIMRVGGMLTDKDKKDLAEAQKELDKLEKQMDEMPASQRAMMEKMLGSQLEQMRSMTSDGSVTMKIITTSIIINPDFRDPTMMTGTFQTGSESPTPSVLQLIQGYLAQLGYDPGPATGRMSQQTEIAISQYQAEKGLEITGQPSPQLAGILQAEVDGL